VQVIQEKAIDSATFKFFKSLEEGVEALPLEDRCPNYLLVVFAEVSYAQSAVEF
jgi:hypothetical protein